MTQSRVRRAFVLGAGLGTRLRPLTSLLPKPLVPVFNKPLVSHTFDLLIAAGIRECMINTHHLPDAWRARFGGDGTESEYRGMRLFFRHEPVLLETGGGLQNIQDFAGDEPLLVFNGDILASLPLEHLFSLHFENSHPVTLALRSSGGPLQISLETGTGLVRDIRGALRPDSPHPRFLFTGIYLLSPDFFSFLPGPGIYSVIQPFLEMLSGGERIGGVVIDEGLWMDLGDRDAYLDAHRVLAGWNRDSSFPLAEPILPIHPKADIHSSARLSGAVAAGPHVRVESGAEVSDCVLWEGAKIASRARLDRCIVCGDVSVSGTHQSVDFA